MNGPLVKAGATTAPLVSVIVLSYERPAYLREALISALRQSIPAPIEVIVADDASPSLAAIREVVVSLGDARVSLIERERNVGVVANLLDAVARARGRYLSILCDDDTWSPQFLERLVGPLEGNLETSLAFSDYWITDSAGTVDAAATEASSKHWGRDRLARGTRAPFGREAVVVRSVQPVMAAVLRKNAIDWSDFPAETGPAYDLWIAYLACRNGAPAFYEPARLTYYRVHGTAQTFVAGVTWNRGKAHVYERILSDGRLPEHSAHFRHMLSFAELRTGISLLREGRTREARDRITASLAGGQRSVRAIAALALAVLPGAIVRRVFALRASL